MTPMAGSTVHLPCVVESDLKTSISWTKHGNSSLPAGSNVLQNGTPVINRNHTKDLTLVELLML